MKTKFKKVFFILLFNFVLLKAAFSGNITEIIFDFNTLHSFEYDHNSEAINKEDYLFAGVPDSIKDECELIKSRLKRIYLDCDFSRAEEYQKYQDTLGKWEDIDYKDRQRASWPVMKHLDRINIMAVAFQTIRNEYYHSEKMLNGITKGLAFWFRTKPKSDNWWPNQIGQQVILAKILILMEKDLPKNLMDTGIAAFFDPTMVRSNYATGQNLVSFSGEQFVRGLLKEYDHDISTAIKAMENEVNITTKEGIQPDYSFHQHGAQLYNDGYGMGFITEITYYADLVRGTKYEFSINKLKILSDYLLNGSRLMVRGKLFDYSAGGRGITRKGSGKHALNLISVCKRLAGFFPNFKNSYDSLRLHIEGSGYSFSYLGNKYFWNSDFMVHQREKYYTSVRMLSKRTKGTEVMNGENLKGFWLPFGLTYILRRGDEYLDIFPVWDWNKLPGVSAPYASEPMKTYQTQTEGFVGGVSDGSYGTAAMVFDKMGTQGKKSWFFFDDEFVALGAGISSVQNETINTTLNQCLSRGKIIVSGSPLNRGEYIMDMPGWILHDSIGYIILQKTPVHIKNVKQCGTWKSINDQYTNDTVNSDVVSIWLDHGKKPENATYQYIILPGIGASDLDKYMKKIPVKIISNTPDIQSVYWEKKNVTGIVFYREGMCSINSKISIKTDNPCMLLVRVEKKTIYISASNPNSDIRRIKVTILFSGEEKKVLFDLPQDGLAGSSVTNIIKYR